MTILSQIAYGHIVEMNAIKLSWFLNLAPGDDKQCSMRDRKISKGIHAHSVAMVIIIQPGNQPGNLPFKRWGLSKQHERRWYGIKHHYHN